MSVVALGYHRVSDDAAALADGYTITTVDFAAQMALLAQSGYKGITMSDALNMSSAHRGVALTFDDGTPDFINTIRPILEQHQFQATLFIPTGGIGKQATWPELAGVDLMSWSDIGSLAAAGYEIASHSVSHRALDAISAEQLAHEMSASAEQIASEIGVKPVGFAYPYGRCTPTISAAAAAAGYQWAATARGGRNGSRTPPHAQRRALVTQATGTGGRFRAIVRYGYSTFIDLRLDIKQTVQEYAFGRHSNLST